MWRSGVKLGVVFSLGSYVQVRGWGEDDPNADWGFWKVELTEGSEGVPVFSNGRPVEKFGKEAKIAEKKMELKDDDPAPLFGEALSFPVTNPNLEDGTPKPKVNVAVLGGTGSGKSVLIGKLLEEIGLVSEAELQHYGRMPRSGSVHGFVLDHLEDERMQGSSLKTSYTSFFTNHHKVTLIDAPGGYKKNDKAAAAVLAADAAIITVPANGNWVHHMTPGNHRTGEIAGGFYSHANYLRAAALRGQKVLVAITFMDMASRPYGQESFEEVRDAIKAFLVRTCNWSKDEVVRNLVIIPVSTMGFHGDNIVYPADPRPWAQYWQWNANSGMDWWSNYKFDSKMIPDENGNRQAVVRRGVTATTGIRRTSPDDWPEVKVYLTIWDWLNYGLPDVLRGNEEKDWARMSITNVKRVNSTGKLGYTGRMVSGKLDFKSKSAEGKEVSVTSHPMDRGAPVAYTYRKVRSEAEKSRIAALQQNEKLVWDASAGFEDKGDVIGAVRHTSDIRVFRNEAISMKVLDERGVQLRHPKSKKYLSIPMRNIWNCFVNGHIVITREHNSNVISVVDLGCENDVESEENIFLANTMSYVIKQATGAEWKSLQESSNSVKMNTTYKEEMKYVKMEPSPHGYKYFDHQNVVMTSGEGAGEFRTFARFGDAVYTDSGMPHPTKGGTDDGDWLAADLEMEPQFREYEMNDNDEPIYHKVATYEIGGGLLNCEGFGEGGKLVPSKDNANIYIKCWKVEKDGDEWVALEKTKENLVVKKLRLPVVKHLEKYKMVLTRVGNVISCLFPPGQGPKNWNPQYERAISYEFHEADDEEWTSLMSEHGSEVLSYSQEGGRSPGGLRNIKGELWQSRARFLAEGDLVVNVQNSVGHVLKTQFMIPGSIMREMRVRGLVVYRRRNSNIYSLIYPPGAAPVSVVYKEATTASEYEEASSSAMDSNTMQVEGGDIRFPDGVTNHKGNVVEGSVNMVVKHAAKLMEVKQAVVKKDANYNEIVVLFPPKAAFNKNLRVKITADPRSMMKSQDGRAMTVVKTGANPQATPEQRDGLKEGQPCKAADEFWFNRGKREGVEGSGSKELLHLSGLPRDVDDVMVRGKDIVLKRVRDRMNKEIIIAKELVIPNGLHILANLNGKLYRDSTPPTENTGIIDYVTLAYEKPGDSEAFDPAQDELETSKFESFKVTPSQPGYGFITSVTGFENRERNTGNQSAEVGEFVELTIERFPGRYPAEAGATLTLDENDGLAEVETIQVDGITQSLVNRHVKRGFQPVALLNGQKVPMEIAFIMNTEKGKHPGDRIRNGGQTSIPSHTRFSVTMTPLGGTKSLVASPEDGMKTLLGFSGHRQIMSGHVKAARFRKTSAQRLAANVNAHGK